MKAGEPNPIWGVALLKIAMEMKKPNPSGLEQILQNVLTKMDIDRESFEAYVHENVGLLKATAKARGY